MNSYKKLFSIRKIMFAGLLLASLFSSTLFASNYQTLADLFSRWRSFEVPPTFEGAPDYRATTFDKRYPEFLKIQKALKEIDTTDWPVKDKVDWTILWAELNGFEFNYKVLKPWQRDPAFYKSVWTEQSDVPAHEGPTHHAVTELWTYQFPLSAKEEQRLIADLSIIIPLNRQAKINLTGNAAELWKAGIRDIREQQDVLADLKKQVANKASKKLKSTIDNASASTAELADWLEAQAQLKNGPSGIGKAQYSWYQNNVHLVPLSWDDETRLLKRELDRAWSSLKLEEHRNRNRPQLKAVSTPAEYDALAKRSAKNLIQFLKEQEIVSVADYFEPALNAKLGNFVPEEKRNFFLIGAHLDPTPLFSHFYHWFELARMKYQPNPSPIRRNALLYNIFDSRNEGTATAVEEMFMQAGLYDNNPRVREIVMIMVAQRSARGLGSLYAHANQMTMQQAGSVHADNTPRGWMKTEPDLLIFEQQLYLRQPGYGSSYITGKYLLERTLADYAKLQEQQSKPFHLKTFFDELNAMGCIPISLGRWQMTGMDDEIKKIRDNFQPLDTLIE